MKIGTKALITLFIVTMITISASGSVLAQQMGDGNTATRSDRKLERLQRRHDRKMELRASVLNMSADELKSSLKTKSFKQILKEHGFANKRAFHVALSGKIKDELMRRGWDEKKIQTYLHKRFDRLHR